VQLRGLGLTHDEIAARVGLEPSSVRKAAARGLRKLGTRQATAGKSSGS
jgi:DNA-directed RNA polymerase specialized sigma24 family protein